MTSRPDRPDTGTEQPSTGAALVAQWTDLRASITAHSTLTGKLTIAGEVEPKHIPATPELLVGVALIQPRGVTDEGTLIQAVTPAWKSLMNQLASDANAFARLDWRQMEELIAGAYSEEGWEVTLTPRSGDKGRDIIAARSDFGAIRILDQVKTYSPGHVVNASDVRAIFGVLALDQKASKAVITTTSQFAPKVYEEFAPVMPTRLELRDGSRLKEWLKKFAQQS